MATVRYRVDGLPQSQWAAAFTPQPPLTAAATFSLRRFIHGFPGTMRVDSPRPAAARSTRASTGGGYLSPSDAAPEWFAPQLWWADINELPVGPTASGAGIHYMPIRRAMPVPPNTPIGSLGPLGPPQVAQGGRKIGGRRSMHWPRVVVRWPNLRGDYQP